MHQWQPASGYQTLDGAQGNTELLGGVSFGYEQSSRHGRGSGRGAGRWPNLGSPDAIGQESNEILDLGWHSAAFCA
jgi:hypothetical protein